MQRPEVLRYRGRWYPIIGYPLDSCTDVWLKRRMGQLQPRSMALARGYQGNWAIRQSKLWLTALLATVREHSSRDDWTHGERDLEWLFPGASGPVVADWYTGQLVVGVGRPARTAQFLMEWPRHRVFEVSSGHVTGSALRDNGPAYREGKAHFERWSRLINGV